MATSTINPIANNYGSTENGQYLKMPDGTLIQWGQESNASSSNHSLSFPVAFVSGDYTVVGTNTSGTQSNFMISTSSSSSCMVYISGTVRLLWIAIGRWK